MNHDETLEDRALRDAARRLGAAAADRVDVDHIAAGVIRRLRETPPARFGWLRIAAAVAVLIGGGFTVRALMDQEANGSAYFISDDLTDLSAEELRTLLAVLDDTTDFGGLGEFVPPEAGSDLTELDAQQLRAVLRTLEG